MFVAIKKSRNSFQAPLIAALLVIAASAAAAQSGESKKLQTIYSKLDALAMKKDIPGLRTLLHQVSTTDCVFIGVPDKSGKVQKKNRDETLQSLERVMPIIDAVTLSASHIEHLSAGKGFITVLVTSTTKMTTKKMPQDGKVHQIAEFSTSEDSWIKVGGNWKLKSSKTLTDKITNDGKSVPLS